MDVFYYQCPECNSRLIESNKNHTIMTCLNCGFAWGDIIKQARFTSLEFIAGVLLAIFVLIACLCSFVSTSYPI